MSPAARILRLAVPALLAIGIATGLAVWLRNEQRAAVDSFTTSLDPIAAAGAAAHADTPAPRPLPSPALVVSTLRQLKLVTVRLDSAVVSQVEDESWRGDVRARVSATATTLYGIDLSQLDDAALRYAPISGAYTITLPPPERIATEISTPADDLRSEVRVGWGRLRDVAGEYHLGRARARLHDVAREQTLTPDHRALVERLSKEQVASLVRVLLDTDRPVSVEFLASPESAPRNTPTVRALSNAPAP